jgi:hypothetical protein
MESQISDLKTEFIMIINNRDTITKIFDILEGRIKKLKIIYNEFISKNEKQIFIFGLDSFRFQSKLMDIEFQDMKRMYLAISNRIYCDYYKLYRILCSYINENIQEKTISEKLNIGTFPIYLDLEPFKEYDFAIINELQNNILILFSSLVNYISIKDRELVTYNKKLNIGLNIDNFVSTFNYDVNNTREKFGLFVKYMHFFQRNHNKILGRFVNKLQAMYLQIDKDIDFDESVEPKFIPCIEDTNVVKEDVVNTNNESTDDKNTDGDGDDKTSDDKIMNDETTDENIDTDNATDTDNTSTFVEKDNFISANKKRKKKKK